MGKPARQHAGTYGVRPRPQRHALVEESHGRERGAAEEDVARLEPPTRHQLLVEHLRLELRLFQQLDDLRNCV